MRVKAPPPPAVNNPNLDNSHLYYYENSLGFVSAAKPPGGHPLSRESTVSRGDRSSGIHSMARFSSLSSLEGGGNHSGSNGRPSWKEKKETIKQRVEAKRNSVRDSSSEDENEESFSSPRRIGNGQRRSGEDLQMDVLTRLAAMDVPPPPPPPRDPKRRLYLLKNEFGRPVSYSFENINDHNHQDNPDDLGVPVVPRSRTPIINANAPGWVPANAPGSTSSSSVASNFLIPPFRRPQHLMVGCGGGQLSSSEQNLHYGQQEQQNNLNNSNNLSPSSHHAQHQYHPQGSPMPQQMYQQHIQNHQQQQQKPQQPIDETPRSRRPIQMQRSLPPQQQHRHHQQYYSPQRVHQHQAVVHPTTVDQHRYSSQPSLLVNNNNAPASTMLVPPVPQNPPAEYWKSPPPLNSIPLHFYEKARLVYSDNSRDCSPQRPLRKKLSNSSAEGKTSRDSVISSPQNAPCSSIEKSSGKSSPSSSISSKDSGCSETSSALSKRLSSAGSSRPLSAVMEKSESFDKESSPVVATPPVRVIVKEVSPPRTDDSAPGFSNKKRRGHYRDAMSELEDIFATISEDRDLLDRAERRDLPTAHQELIAQARERFQPGPSEETSRHDDSSAEMFSDMDNFMNWNTSSSFENLPSYSSPNSRRRARSRTPANRRSAVIDKVTDDMAYRAARANNRPQPEVLSPIAKVDHSYLLSTPGLSPAPSVQSVVKTIPDLFEDDEPDLHKDDVLYRSIRDANANAVTDPQPKFGIPKDNLVTGCSNKDYLHATPNPARKRSTFRASKNPDVVLDDMAFRSLRKDSNLSDPGTLGVVKDPNMSNLHMHSCWHHKMKAREYARETDTGPYVFYPKKNQAVLKSLSEQIAQIIKKQSGNPQGGEEEQIVTYEDLRDPKVYEAMKYTLNIIEKETNGQNCDTAEEEDEEEEDWKGKGIFELLSSNIVDLLEKKKSKSQTVTEDEKEEVPGDDKENLVDGQDLVVGHCILEHDLSEFNKTLRKHLQERTTATKDKIKTDDDGQEVTTTADKLRQLAGGLNIADTLENIREEGLKLERSFSSTAQDQPGLETVQEEDSLVLLQDVQDSNLPKEEQQEVLEPEKTKIEHEQNKNATFPAEIPEQETNMKEEEDPPLEVLPLSTASAENLVRKLSQISTLQGEPSSQQPQTATLPDALGFLNPVLLITCYLLACVHQFMGLDFMTALGVLLATVSMVSMWFI